MKTRSGKFRRVNELYNKQAPVYTLLKAKNKKQKKNKNKTTT